MSDQNTRKSHWDKVYSQREEKERSWSQTVPFPSIQIIRRLCPELDKRVIDVGAGASKLVDELLSFGYLNPAVLDISDAPLIEARQRLGVAEKKVQWIVGDVCELRLPSVFTLWHDRAVFHFLTSRKERVQYIASLEAALVHGGHAVIGTFSPLGPAQCSGLPIVRYDPSSLSAELGSNFKLLATEIYTHLTPWGSKQEFIFCSFTYVAGES